MRWSPHDDPADGMRADGEFWLPDRPDRRIHGVLRYSGRRGAWIALDGSLELEARDDYPEYKRIEGIADDRPAALFDCAQFSMPAQSKSRQVIVAQHALLGRTHDAISSNLFTSVIVGFDALNEWLGYSPIRYDIPRVVAPGEVSGKAEFVQPEQPEVQLEDGAVVRIIVGGGVNSSRYQATVYQSAHLQIDFPSAVTVQYCYEMASRFRDFMALTIEYPVQTREAQLVPFHSADGDSVLPYDWLAGWNVSSIPPDEPASWTHMTKTIREAADYWPQMVQSWFANWDRLADAAHQIIGLAFAPPTYWDTRLLLAAGAAEAYHRRYIGTTRWSKPEFKRRRKSLLDAIPTEELDWVANATAFAYEPTLHERLIELRDRSSGALPMLFDRYPDWPARTSKMRNDYIHRGKRERPSYSAEEIYESVEVTLRVVRTCILLDLGMPAAEIGMGLLSHAHYLRLIGGGR